MTAEEANSEKYALATKLIARQPRFEGVEALPARLRELIEHSERLYARVERLDTQLRVNGAAMPHGQPLAEQFARVEGFFREHLAMEFPRREFGRRKHRPE
jgi:regulator of CtrA degradation